MPKLGSALFMSAFVKKGVIFGDVCNTTIFEENFAAIFIEFPNANEIVLESWHYLTLQAGR